MTSSRRAITASPSSASIRITRTHEGPEQLTIPTTPVKVSESRCRTSNEILANLLQAITAYEHFRVEAVLLGGYCLAVDFRAVVVPLPGGLTGRSL